jgi:hypothetical protein
MELAGLVTVAVGISRTRAGFTHRPRLDQRVVAALRRYVVGLRRHRKPTVVLAQGRGVVHARGVARGRVTVGPWDGLTDEDRFARIRDQLQNLQTQQEDANERIALERSEREAAMDREEKERIALETELREAVADAAAGNLRLEALGASLLAFGLVTQGIGIILG